MTPYDRTLFRRALAFAAVAALLCLGVIATTDEAASTAAARLARLAALAPALAAFGSTLALAQARARGEYIALGALGVGPLRVALGAVLAGWVAGALAVTVAALPWSDPAALFPAVTTPAAWRITGAALFNPASGVVVRSDGAIALGHALPLAPDVFRLQRLSAVLAIAPLAVVTPVWVGVPARGWLRVAAVAAAAAATIVLLHAVAAARLGAPWLVAGTAPLLFQTLSGLRGARRAGLRV